MRDKMTVRLWVVGPLVLAGLIFLILSFLLVDGGVAWWMVGLGVLNLVAAFYWNHRLHRDLERRPGFDGPTDRFLT